MLADFYNLKLNRPIVRNIIGGFLYTKVTIDVCVIDMQN